MFFFFFFFFFFSIGKPCMTPVSSVKTTKSYKVPLVTINRQTLLNSVILRQDYGTIRVSADESYEVCRLGHHVGSTFAGTDQNGRALLPNRTRLCGPCIAAIDGSSLQLHLPPTSTVLLVHLTCGDTALRWLMLCHKNRITTVNNNM